MNIKELEDTKQTQQGLCKLAAQLGYKDPFHQLRNNDGSVVGDLLEFLDDNPGACAAIIEWVSDNAAIFNIKEEDEDEEDEEDA